MACYTTISSTSTVWYTWNCTYNAATTTNIWVDWNTVNAVNYPIDQVVQVAPVTQAVQGTPRKVDHEKEESQKRAEIQLRSLLTAEQEAEYNEKRYFELKIEDRIYRIQPGNVVKLMVDGKVRSSFCIHPELTHGLPSPDWAIAQKLMLETDEKEFLRIANRADYPVAA